MSGNANTGWLPDDEHWAATGWPMIADAVERNRQLLQQVIPVIGRALPPGSSHPGLVWLLQSLIAKSCKLFKAVNLLAVDGMGDESQVLVRSMFELAIHAAWITKPSNACERTERARLCVDWHDVHQLKWAEECKRNGIPLGDIDTVDWRKEVTQRLGSDELARLEAWRSCWGKDMRSLCKEVDPELERQYLTLYKYTSHVTHSNDIERHLEAASEGEHAIPNLAPSMPDVCKALEASNLILCSLLSSLTCVQALDLAAAERYMLHPPDRQVDIAQELPSANREEPS